MTTVRKSLLALAIAGFVGIGAEAGAAEPWGLVTCPPESDAKALELRQDVLAAAPGSAVYVPHPFPVDPAHVAADFVFQYREGWSEEAEELRPPETASVLGLIEEGRARYEVIEIADWRPERCGWLRGTRVKSALLRVFETNSGDEAARAIIGPTGLLDKVVARDLAASESIHSFAMADGHDIASLGEVASVAQDYGLALEDPQYVTLSSPSIACREENPCVVGRIGERVLLYRAGKLFELEHLSNRFSLSAFTRSGQERDALIGSMTEGQAAVSLGGDQMTLATPLPKP
jgi:hypothetical protein